MTTNTLTQELQQQCTTWGVYWRAPDAHGVELAPDQAISLLRRALGVEVEIKARSSDCPQFECLGRALCGSCAALAAAEAQPVAWRFQFPTSDRWHYTEHGPHEASRPGLKWEPLHAAAPAPVAQRSASLTTLQGEAQVLRALLADALPWFEEAAADQPDPEALPHLQALRDRIRAALAPTPGALL